MVLVTALARIDGVGDCTAKVPTLGGRTEESGAVITFERRSGSEWKLRTESGAVITF